MHIEYINIESHVFMSYSEDMPLPKTKAIKHVQILNNALAKYIYKYLSE